MANQINIDIGAAANDGTGDPLRTAFNYVNNNFSNVWNTGLPSSNVQFSDNRILTVNTNANLVLAPNGIGKVASNVDIVPNTANVFALGGASRRWNTVYGQYLDLSHNAVIGGNLVVTGNLSAGNISYTSNVFVGDLEGSVFDGASSIVLDVIDSTIYVDNYRYANGVPVSFSGNYSNANVAAFLPTYTGNLSANNITAGNVFTAQTVTANDAYINTGTFPGDDNTGDAALYVGSPTFTNLGTDVMAQFTGNVTTYAQINLQNWGNTPTSSGDYILTADNGDDSTHYLDMGITSSTWDGSLDNVLEGLVANNGYLYVQDGNLTLGTRAGNVSYSWNFDTTGNLTVAGNVIPAGNNTQSLGSATQQWNDLYLSNSTIYMNGVPVGMTGNVLTVSGANVVTATAGNISADYFLGNGSQLTGIVAGTGNLTIVDQTINGTTINGNINLTPEGSGFVVVPKLSIPVGTVIQSTTAVVPIIENLILDSVIDYSIGSETLPAGSYGNPDGIAAPWTVFEFTTVPSPALEQGDILGGAGIITGAPPGSTPTTIEWIGTGAGNTAIVVTTQTFDGLPTPVPDPGTQITVSRITSHATFEIQTIANTDIAMNPGPGGIIATGGDIIPQSNDDNNLGSPGSRFNGIWLGSGAINLVDDTLGINQTINASDGNMIIAGGTGLSVGEFTFYSNVISLASPSQDITIGTLGDTGNIIMDRGVKVINANIMSPAFEVTSTGLTSVFVGENLPPTKAALTINGSTSGNSQPRGYSGTMLQITAQDTNSARVSIDSFGNSVVSAITGRNAHGNVDVPLQSQENDIMLRLAGQAWNNANSYQGNIIRMNMLATAAVTNTSAPTRFNFQTTPVGSVTFQDVANIDTSGITLLNDSNITFADGSVQTIAFNPSNVVTSLTVGTGLTQTLSQGNVAIDATGVQNVVGTSNQVIVTDSGSKNLTLSLPQSINTNSSVQFGNITVGNLVVTGSQTAANTLTLNDKTFTLANNSTSNTQIDGGGMILGNVLDGSYYRTFLYDLNNNRWDTDGAGLATLELTAGNVYMQTLWANNSGHFGGAFTGNLYPGAVVQADSDVNSYSQILNQNHSSGTNASTDFVATNDIGTDDVNYIDMGINSSTYSNPAFSISGANDGYLFINGGNLAIGTQSAGKNILFHTGNTTSDALRATITDSGLSVVGNVSAGNISANNISANTLTLTGNLTVPFSSAVLTTAAQPNVTSVGTLTSLTVSGNASGGNLNTAGRVVATANVTGGNLTTGGQVVATGNITGGNLSIGAIAASSLTATGNVNGANLNATGGTFSLSINATGNVTGANINTGGQVIATGNIRGANFNTTGVLAATGNVDGGNLRTGGIVTASGNLQTQSQLVSTVATGTPPLVISSTTKVSGLNVEQVDGFDASQANTASTIVVRDSAANIAAANFNGNGVSATGNISAAFFLGNGSALTGITATSALTAVTVTGNAQANITSVGTLTSLSVSGNITAGNVSGTLLTGTLTTAAQPNVTSVGTLSSLTVTGNVSGGNLLTAGLASVTGNITGGNLITGGLASITGNITGGNLITSGLASVTGNITGGNLITGGLASITGNITGGNLITSGLASVTGNITGGNLITGGLASITGNITGGNLITSGLASVTGNATVGNLTTAGTVVTKNLVFDAGPFDNGSITTTLALDFNNGTLQFVTLGAANPTFTLSNAKAGKVIILIIRNASGSNRTVTHGVAAGNTTTGSATNTVNNGRIGMYQYICKDDTTANVQLGFM